MKLGLHPPGFLCHQKETKLSVAYKCVPFHGQQY